LGEAKGMTIFMTKFLLYALFNYIEYLLMILALIYAAKRFFNLSPRNHMTIKEIVVFSFLFSLLLTSISFIDLNHQRYITPALGSLILFLENLVLLIWLKRYTRYRNYRMPLLLLVLLQCTKNIVEMGLQYFLLAYEEWFRSLPTILDFLIDLMWPLPAFLVVFLICKTVPLTRGFERLLNFPKFIYAGGILYYIIEFIVFIMNIDTLRSPVMANLSLYVSVGFLALLLVVIVLVREIDHNYSLSYSEKLFTEQQNYVEHVESLYNDLQKLQHDYKNLLSGMYLQVSEGRIDEVKRYLSDNLVSIDEALQNKLKSQKQLRNIRIVEVKSLILAKMITAKDSNVTLNLEVVNPISQISIALTDFLRILGIAIDNAIEAAEETDQGATVDVLFIQENNYVEVVVKNPFKGSIDSDKIWQDGYSTKGDNRGLGLSNYRAILDGYHQVLRETRIADNQFTQTILITL